MIRHLFKQKFFGASKTTPVDADSVAVIDSADSSIVKKTTWANIKATLFTDPSLTVSEPTTTSVGYLGIPQNSKSANYTTVITDSGKHILHPSSDANVRTFTIDSNANVAYPIDTAITFINDSANDVTIAITSDTLVLVGSGTTGSRTLAQYGVATAIKIGTTRWYISGVNLT